MVFKLENRISLFFQIWCSIAIILFRQIKCLFECSAERNGKNYSWNTIVENFLQRLNKILKNTLQQVAQLTIKNTLLHFVLERFGKFSLTNFCVLFSGRYFFVSFIGALSASHFFSIVRPELDVIREVLSTGEHHCKFF